jgi:hypothetical protein
MQPPERNTMARHKAARLFDNAESVPQSSNRQPNDGPQLTHDRRDKVARSTTALRIAP